MSGGVPIAAQLEARAVGTALGHQLGAWAGLFWSVMSGNVSTLENDNPAGAQSWRMLYLLYQLHW